MTLLLAIFAILFVAVGSVCAADSNSDVISDKNLNSEEIIANSNGIDNSNEVITSQGSQISVDTVKADDSKVDSVSAANVKESSETSNDVKIDEPSKDVKENTVITNVGATSNTVTVAQVISAAASVKTYVEKNKALPSTVTVGSYKLSAAKFSYLESVAIQYLNSGESTATKISILSVSGSSATYSINKNPTKAAYVSVAKSVYNYFKNNKVAPGYATVNGAKADFRVYTYAFAKILVFYKNNNKYLPNTCTFDSSVFKKVDPTPDPTEKYTIAQVLTASVNVKNYVEKNKALPSTVTVGSKSVTIDKYSYLASMAVQYIKAGKSTSTYIKALNATHGSTKYSMDENVYTGNYVNAAKTVSSAISSKGVAPSYVAVPSSKADFRVYTYGFAKILNYYKNNKALPNYCRFNSTAFVLTPTANTTFSFNQIINAANDVKSYVDSYRSVPTYVEVGSYKLTIAQFTYLESVLIKNLNSGKTSGSIKFANIKSPSIVNGSVNITASKASYVAAADDVYIWAKEHSVDPVNVTINSKKVPFNLYTYGFAKILVWYGNHNNTLPSTCSFDSSVFEGSVVKIPSDLRYSKGINEKASAIDKSVYLVLKGHCTSNSVIKQLAQELTKNCKNDWEKATALFNYVRDKVSYSSYFNSVYDATGTLSRKSGNCCDQSNLLVSLCRNAGLACRYCHGNPCYFRSGLTVGHVWAQIYIESTSGPVWVAADPVSTSNRLGYIVNWNSMGTLNQYSLLTF